MVLALEMDYNEVAGDAESEDDNGDDYEYWFFWKKLK